MKTINRSADSQGVRWKEVRNPDDKIHFLCRRDHLMVFSINGEEPCFDRFYRRHIEPKGIGIRGQKFCETVEPAIIDS